MRALGLDARGTCLRERDARARRVLLGDTGGVGELARASRPRGGFRVDTASAFAQGRELRGEGRERRAGPLAFGGDRREARLERGHALADARLGGCRVRRRDAAALLFFARGEELLLGAGGRGLALPHVVVEAVDLAVDAHDPRRELRPLLGRVAERRAIPAERAPAQLGTDRLVLRPLRRLLAQRLHARADLAEDVVHADELRFRELHPLKRFLSSQLQPPGPGGLLDDGAPIGGAQGEDLIGETLAHDDEGVVGQIRAGEKVLQIAEPDAGPVHQILGFTVAVETAPDLDLFEGDRKSARRVVELHDRLRHSERLPALAPPEDELLVALRAQDARVVLAERPANPINDVRLAGTVRANDRGDPRGELEVRFVYE